MAKSGKRRRTPPIPVTQEPPSHARSKEKLAKNNELISRYHALLKQLAKCQNANQRMALEQELAALGGPEAYQRASLYGTHRGSDTSRWLLPRLPRPSHTGHLRLLDVGALSLVYRPYSWIRYRSIDLHPRQAGIEQLDFLQIKVEEGTRKGSAKEGVVEQAMDLALEEPAVGVGGYEVICLSLVLNYCGDPRLRGAMLQQAHRLLTADGLLYLVLPRACVENSRRLSAEYLAALLQCIGFRRVDEHLSSKLYYSLWAKQTPPLHLPHPIEPRLTGPTRNNFRILL